MILFWIVAAVLTAGVVALLLPPLLRPRAAGHRRAEYDLEVYRDQLTELERDQSRGLIGAEQAAAARAEIGRRMLTVAGEGLGGKKAADSESTVAKGLAVALVVVIPVGALALYLPLGHPDLPAQPLAGRNLDAERAASASATAADGAKALAQLKGYLEKNPEDGNAWTTLGKVLASLRRYEESAGAYRRAVALAPTNPDLLGSYAEMLTKANKGALTDESRTAFESVLAKAPGDPRARYYLAVDRAEAGDPQGALDRLVALAADAPADAGWLPPVRQRITELATLLGKDPAAVMPQPKPAENPVAAAAPEDRTAMVRGMVEGLAAKLEANPADIDGWMRLARSYQVLGDKDKANQALKRAADQAPENVDVLMAYAETLLDGIPEDGPPGPLPPAFIQIMRTIRSIDPENMDALWFLGLEAATAGRPTEAADLWTRLLTKFDPSSEDYTQVKTRLDALSK